MPIPLVTLVNAPKERASKATNLTLYVHHKKNNIFISVSNKPFTKECNITLIRMLPTVVKATKPSIVNPFLKPELLIIRDPPMDVNSGKPSEVIYRKSSKF